MIPSPGNESQRAKPLPFSRRLRYNRLFRAEEHRGKQLVKAMLQRFPRQRLTVIALINRSEGNPSEIARRIADLGLFYAA
jgi:hypothetical protein